MENNNIQKNITTALFIGWILLIALAMALSMSGCHGIDFEPVNPDPVDTVDNPIDTTIDVPPEPILLDTCETLVTLTDTAFVGLYINYFNGMPLMPEYQYHNTQLVFASLASLLQFYWPQYSYTEYQGDNAIYVIADGTDNSSLKWYYVTSRDAAGVRNQLNASTRGFYHYGAMTADEAIAEAEQRENIKGFHFAGTDWAPSQYDEFARAACHFDLCKRGEQRAIYTAATGITQSVVDSTILFEWEIVTQ